MKSNFTGVLTEKHPIHGTTAEPLDFHSYPAIMLSLHPQQRDEKAEDSGNLPP